MRIINTDQLFIFATIGKDVGVPKQMDLSQPHRNLDSVSTNLTPPSRKSVQSVFIGVKPFLPQLQRR
jgi:hypothetical protein